MNRFARRLTPENYDTACDLAGAALLRRVPAAATILQITEDRAWNEFSAAVYIAADFENAIRYVGSTVRAGTVGDRIQEQVLAGRAAPVDPPDGGASDCRDPGTSRPQDRGSRRGGAATARRRTVARSRQVSTASQAQGPSVTILADGQLIEQSWPAELLANPQDDRTKRFLRRITEAGRLQP